MRDSREFQVLAGEVKNVRWDAATDECAFEIAGAKFNAKIAKEQRLVPRENDRLAVAYDEQNEVWNFKNLTSDKWLKNYSWRAYLMIFEEAVLKSLPRPELYGFILMIPIFCLCNYLPTPVSLFLIFAVFICLLLSVPLMYTDDKTPTDKANAYLALRKFLKEADL
ncbi:MAG: hypothetical protein ACTTJF_00750 [Campylobacter sp.]|uniref:hypothetical protein n=1 Tax=Campylobacter sp. TaxID=205 RepID=UPI003F9EE6B0